MDPTPQNRLALAEKHAKLFKLLLHHPVIRRKPNGEPDQDSIPVAVYHVVDFEVRTYRDYILPLLPPDADQHCPRQMVFPPYEENNDLMTDDLFPRMSVGGFEEKWMDCHARGIMIAMIITDPAKMAKFGPPVDLGPEVNAAASALMSD